MAFALCAATQAVAVDQSNDAFASANIQKKTLHVVNPFAETKAGDKDKIERFGEMSSQPWTQTVGWHPGEPSAFMDAKIHEPKLQLFWIGAEPQP